MAGEEKSLHERDGYARSAGITYLLVKARSLVHQSWPHVPGALALSASAVQGVAIPIRNEMNLEEIQQLETCATKHGFGLYHCCSCAGIS